MAEKSAILDACLLYSAPLRDLFLHLAEVKLYTPLWTDLIQEEWESNLSSNRPRLTIEKLHRTRQLMYVHFKDSLVTGYESLIDTLVLPDPDDRHVLAAAIHAGTNCIVTFNLQDFPEEVLAPFNIVARHPDPFASDLFDDDIDRFCEAARLQRMAVKNPPKSADAFLESLTKAGLPLTADRLKTALERI